MILPISGGPSLIHAICTLYGNWPPGDPRGWRSRRHKRHSSGDYKDPPPPGEHEGLHRHARSSMTTAPARLRPDQYPLVGRAFLWKRNALGCSARILSCGPTHLHVLFDGPAGDATPVLGKCKQYSSLKLADHRGQLWGERAKIIRVRDLPHARNTFAYIRDHALKEGAWIWRCDRDARPERAR
ncbi:MAG: hypothetical protein SYC29_03405 [Planctomycetota bacterium]|nr:hypothetical protein [Planctomycetota bacterium]